MAKSPLGYYRKWIAIAIHFLAKIYEMDFSAKGPRRGIGLKSVRNIINEKYNNVTLNTIIKDGVFKQELIISQLLTSE